MRQISLQFKTRIQNVNVMNNNIEVKKVILQSIFSLFGILAIVYVVILGSMVANIVQRKTLEKEALILGSEVGNLELSYLSVFNNVDLALSSSMGFKEVKATFATRKSLGSLRINSNEI